MLIGQRAAEENEKRYEQIISRLNSEKETLSQTIQDKMTTIAKGAVEKEMFEERIADLEDKLSNYVKLESRAWAALEEAQSSRR